MTTADISSGHRLMLAKDFAAAEGVFRRLVEIEPDNAEAWQGRGTALHLLGKFESAAGCYQRALELGPPSHETCNNLAAIYDTLGQLPLALEWCARAIHLRPQVAELHRSQGALLCRMNRRDEAENSFQRALALQPGHVQAHLDRAANLVKLKQPDAAASHYRQALMLQPDSSAAHNNLAILLAAQGRLEEATVHYRLALHFQPNNAEAANNLGNSLAALGHHDAALNCFDQALRLKPDLAEAHYNRAHLWLQLGNYEQGWPEHEWRWRCPDFPMERFAFAQPRWDGSELDGRTILLIEEQGLGDTLQTLRYIPLVKNQGGRVILCCRRELLTIASRLDGVAQTLTTGDAFPPFDVYTSMMSLPGLFHPTVPQSPYLLADAERVHRWSRELGDTKKFKIGIVWQGSPTHARDHFRSFPLSQLAALARLPGVQLISLQKGAGREQLDAFAQEFGVIDVAALTSMDVDDTAAVMCNLDLVVATDTSVAHLAGALGRNVWVALSTAPDWRWLLHHSTTRWYPTMRLFRQTRLGEWEPVFAAMAAALTEMRGTG